MMKVHTLRKETSGRHVTLDGEIEEREVEHREILETHRGNQWQKLIIKYRRDNEETGIKEQVE